jgi:hypothetical protein
MSLQETLAEPIILTDSDMLEKELARLDLDFSLDEEEEEAEQESDEADEEQSEVFSWSTKSSWMPMPRGVQISILSPIPERRVWLPDSEWTASVAPISGFPQNSNKR